MTLVLGLPDRAMGMGCWLYHPPAETDSGPDLSFPVNLWKIYKAVEKLGAYEMVRKAPESSPCCISPYVLSPFWGKLGKSVSPTKLSLPPDRRKGRGLPCLLVFCCSKQVFLSSPSVLPSLGLERCLGQQSGSPREGELAGRQMSPLQPPLLRCWRSSCKTAIPAKPGPCR